MIMKMHLVENANPEKPSRHDAKLATKSILRVFQKNLALLAALRDKIFS
jgi:hypothetical protein